MNEQRQSCVIIGEESLLVQCAEIWLSRGHSIRGIVSADARITAELEETRAPVGGGSLPGFELPSRAVTLRGAIGAERLCSALRRGPVPVLARVRDDRVQLDARTLLPGDEAVVASALRRALADV